MTTATAPSQIMPKFDGLSHWLAFAHKAYGSRQMLNEAIWFDAWVEHCWETGHERFIEWGRKQCLTLYPRLSK